MPLPVRLRRLLIRTAYIVLRAYWFVRRPHLRGVKCVLTVGDQVLLVRHAYGHWDWDLPGGSVRRNEEPVHAAQREMHEELGLQIDDFVALGELPVTMYYRHDTLYCFAAELRDFQLKIDRGELAAVKWFGRDDLPPDLSRFVKPILALAATPTRSCRGACS